MPRCGWQYTTIAGVSKKYSSVKIFTYTLVPLASGFTVSTDQPCGLSSRPCAFMRVPVSTSSSSAEATNGTRGMRLRSCSIFAALPSDRQAHRACDLPTSLPGSSAQPDSYRLSLIFPAENAASAKIGPLRALPVTQCRSGNRRNHFRLAAEPPSSRLPARNYFSAYADCCTQPLTVLNISWCTHV